MLNHTILIRSMAICKLDHLKTLNRNHSIKKPYTWKIDGKKFPTEKKT